MQIWDATTGSNVVKNVSLKYVKGMPAPWNAVAWSPDSKQVVIGGNGDAQLLDAQTGKTIAYFGHHSGTINSVAWSPDGAFIAIGKDDTTVEVWNVATSTNIYTYTGHSASVFTVAWSPDGKRIVSGSSDGTAQVWDALTGNHVYTYRGHADYYWGHFTSNASVDSVAWSPDGRKIVSGSDDMTVQVWQAMG